MDFFVPAVIEIMLLLSALLPVFLCFTLRVFVKDHSTLIRLYRIM